MLEKVGGKYPQKRKQFLTSHNRCGLVRIKKITRLPARWVRVEQNTHLFWAILTKKHGARADKEYGPVTTLPANRLFG